METCHDLKSAASNTESKLGDVDVTNLQMPTLSGNPFSDGAAIASFIAASGALFDEISKEGNAVSQDDAFAILAFVFGVDEASTSYQLLKAGLEASGIFEDIGAPNGIVQGSDDSDTIDADYSDTGGDSISSGNDIIEANGGDDSISGSGGADQIDGGSGTDTIDYSSVTARVGVNLQSGGTAGAASSDMFISIENVTGSAFDDLIYGTDGANTIRGGEGNDRLRGEDGDDTIFGGTGDDEIRGGNGNDIIHGGAGADDIRGGSGRDTLSYENADSRINVDLRGTGSVGDAKGDTFTSIENVIGSDFNDYIYANSENNIIEGRDGNDRLRGHNGEDDIYGGDGDDIIYSGSQQDDIWGGSGSDTFEFRTSNGVNTIHDYEDGIDIISIGGGHSYSDLTVSENGNDTEISFARSVIVLKNTESNVISEDDFIFL